MERFGVVVTVEVVYLSRHDVMSTCVCTYLSHACMPLGSRSSRQNKPKPMGDSSRQPSAVELRFFSTALTRLLDSELLLAFAFSSNGNLMPPSSNQRSMRSSVHLCALPTFAPKSPMIKCTFSRLQSPELSPTCTVPVYPTSPLPGRHSQQLPADRHPPIAP